MRKKTKSRFTYKARTKEDVKKRANQSGGSFDSIFDASVMTFTPKEGDYSLRILPNTWDEDPQHYGHDIWLHYSVGPDKNSYLCLQKMKGEACPVCEAVRQAEADGDVDTAKELKSKKRVALYVVDRDEEDDGPKIWSAPWTVDRDLSSLSMEKSGEILNIDDPNDGYDVEFSREGQGVQTKYVGLKISRHTSVLSDDEDTAEEWMDYVIDNTIPDSLNYFEHDYIQSIFDGTKAVEDDDDDDGDDADEAPWDDDDDKDEEPAAKKSHGRVKDEETSEDSEEDDDDDDASDDGDDVDEEPEEKPRRRRLKGGVKERLKASSSRRASA